MAFGTLFHEKRHLLGVLLHELLVFLGLSLGGGGHSRCDEKGKQYGKNQSGMFFHIFFPPFG
jgi:hypothetical protein